MKNVHNAVSDVLQNLGVSRRLRDQIETSNEEPLRTIVRLYCLETQELRLEIEVLEDDSGQEGHSVCVLQRTGLSRRSASRILDTLLDLL